MVNTSTSSYHVTGSRRRSITNMMANPSTLFRRSSQYLVNCNSAESKTITSDQLSET